MMPWLEELEQRCVLAVYAAATELHWSADGRDAWSVGQAMTQEWNPVEAAGLAALHVRWGVNDLAMPTPIAQDLLQMPEAERAWVVVGDTVTLYQQTADGVSWATWQGDGWGPWQRETPTTQNALPLWAFVKDVVEARHLNEVNAEPELPELPASMPIAAFPSQPQLLPAGNNLAHSTPEDVDAAFWWEPENTPLA